MTGDVFGLGSGESAPSPAGRLGRVLAVGGRGVVLAVLSLALAAPLALAANPEIAIRDGGYDPANVTVMVGEPVTWTNDSTVGHTVTSDDGTLDSGTIAPGEAYGHVFDAPGTYTYHCTLHPDEMTGSIVAEAAPVVASPSHSLEPTPPSGTLPPNFSPVPSIAPTAVPTAAATASPTPAPSTAPASGRGGSGGFPGTLVAVVVLGGIAMYLVRAFVGRGGRPAR